MSYDTADRDVALVHSCLSGDSFPGLVPVTTWVPLSFSDPLTLGLAASILSSPSTHCAAEHTACVHMRLALERPEVPNGREFVCLFCREVTEASFFVGHEGQTYSLPRVLLTKPPDSLP